jgi:addiction module RelE/StbE family toxin
MRFDYHRKFKKQFDKIPFKIQNEFERRVLFFQQNQFHPLLNNHKLTGEYEGCRSINVTGDIRAIFKFKNEDTIIFIAIGSHPELYE